MAAQQLTLGGYQLPAGSVDQSNTKPSLPGERGSAERMQALSQQWTDAQNSAVSPTAVQDYYDGSRATANNIGMTDDQYDNGLSPNAQDQNATTGPSVNNQIGVASPGGNVGGAPVPSGNDGQYVGPNGAGDTSVRDGGTDLSRGAYSTGKQMPTNTTNPDGNIQGQFKDTRGNEYRADSVADMQVERTNAASAAQNQREMTAEEMSSQRLNDILSQDSPLMALAQQMGMEQANARGLSNSSLAAGASMREMAQQATPLAMQEAEATKQAMAQNQTLESARLESNAGREQQTGMFNAEQENAASSQEFGTEAEMRLQNAAMANDMLNSDRQRTMSYALQQLAGDQDYAKQTLASNSAVDIANIEGQYKQLISENDTAARMYDATYQSIADILGNNEIYADEASEKVNYLVGMMEQFMGTLFEFDNVDFGDAGSSGDGKKSDFVS